MIESGRHTFIPQTHARETIKNKNKNSGYIAREDENKQMFSNIYKWTKKQ